MMDGLKEDKVSLGRRPQVTTIDYCEKQEKIIYVAGLLIVADIRADVVARALASHTVLT